MYELLWFFGGILAYKLSSFALNYGRMIIFVKEVNMLGLILLASVTDDLTLIKKMKYKILEESETDAERIKIFKLADEQVMESWKAIAIAKFALIWPKKYRGVVDFTTWEEAINAVNDHYKEQIWK